MDVAQTELKESQSVTTTPQKNKPRRRGRVELTIQEIIEKGESHPAPFRTMLLWSCLSGFLCWASFAPLAISPLAWIAPLPWLWMILSPQLSRRSYVASYLGGLCFYVPVLQWMRYGDPLMYIGWGALTFYLAAYLPIFIMLSRVAVHRWRWPLAIAAPVVWTGLEYFRGFFFTGFGWYYLGHSQIGWTELIQISDLVGAYGVSFVMMAVIGAVATKTSRFGFRRLGLSPKTVSDQANDQTMESATAACSPGTGKGLVFALILLLATLGYGFTRLQQEDFQPGPRVALIQGNFKAALQTPHEEYEESYVVHNALTGMAVLHQPDIILWPEGMFRYPLFETEANMTDSQLRQVAPYWHPEQWRNDEVRNTLVSMSEKAGAAMVIGLATFSAKSTGVDQCNSAQFITPNEGLGLRYDKLHRVPFGEYVPGQDGMLSGMVPENFGLTAGTEAVPFDYQDWRFAPVICFEDTVPHVTRRITRSIENSSEKPVDFIANLSNDGWFAGSSEHDQHLITASFRAVELRKPVVRAANMGISAVIDGNGRVIEPEVFLTKDPLTWQPLEISYRDPETGRLRRKLEAVVVQTVPLDSRGSVYLASGDWFAAACLFSCCAMILRLLDFRRTTPTKATKTNTTP